MDLRIREQRLPGIGHRYDLTVGRGTRLVIVVQHSGGRMVSIGTSHADEPDAAVSLTSDQAMAVAALLTGARFTIDTRDDDRTSADEIAIETVVLGPASPAVGVAVDDVSLPADSDATILAVIRDSTPELVEDDPVEPCHAGDRVVVSARRERLPDVVAQLAG
jgi:TrkA domain protein